MPKHYIYRIDHDLGFAPNPDYGICTLCGCKTTTIEMWAERGSWIIGIGGNGTGKPNKLIYAMEVEEVLPSAEFKERHRRKSSYLQGKFISPGANVLLSRKFYYFGNKAIDIPAELRHIIISSQGCKRVRDEDVSTLRSYLEGKYSFGKHGRPNNNQSRKISCRGKC